MRKSKLDAADALCDRALEYLNQGNEDKAMELWFEAAPMGSSRAMRNIGVTFEGRGQLKDAAEWYTRSVDAGDIEAWLNLGLIYYNDGEFDQAREVFEQGARHGNANCAFNRAVIARDVDYDASLTRSWFLTSAELGSADAMNIHAVTLNNEGLREEALQWYRRAADAGSPHAMENLGDLCRVEGDVAGARAWLERAVTAGSTNAQEKLTDLDSPSRLSVSVSHAPSQTRLLTGFTWAEIRGS